MATAKKTSKRARGSAKRSTRTQPGRESLLSALAAIQRAAKRLGAKWYVFGAQAVAFHGVPRMTGDIDVTILVDAPTDEIVRALRREGIVAARFDAAWRAK